MWICPECSNGNEDRASFCTECGTPRPVKPISEAQQTPLTESWQTGVPGTAAPEKPKKKSKKGLIIAAVALLALAAAGLLIFVFLGGGGAPRFRETLYHRDLWDGSVLEDRYTYTGDTGRIDSYEDGKLAYYSTFTCNSDGYIQTELYYEAGGRQLSRLEYEYDKNGNMATVRRYSPDGKLEMLVERSYNDYRVIERSVTTYYTDYGTVDTKNVVEFSDRYNGVAYDLDAKGNRTDTFTYKRVYDSNNQLTEEWCYDADDGEMFRVNTYTRDEYHNILSYDVRYYDGDQSHYRYEYEKIG